MENLKKKTLGRRKIEIKKIEKKSSLQVAFTKRRGGLFRKATELAVVCGVEIGILVKSPAGKLYSSGQPEALINRVAPSIEARIKYEEAEKRRAGGGMWWEGLQLRQLEQLVKSLEISRGMVAENLKNYDPPSSLQQLITADDFVIAADTHFLGDQD
ncbi:agamous-like MADS-box protein AGL62 [Salvia divinorum]|uniref:Agamous-like MADS-box protein AGL62 n=1 Tax=Salvia divinorum TaxID=28513 RepID=A0ABD1HI24_SALDI